MRKAWILAILFGAGLFSLGLTISLFAVRNRLDTRVHASGFSQMRGPLEFTFSPNHDFLNIVIMTFKNPGLQNEENFSFIILDQNGSKVRQVNFSGRNIGDPSDLRFQFEPIVNSAAGKFSARIEGEMLQEPLGVAVDKEGEIAYAAYYRVRDKRFSLPDIAEDPVFFVFWTLVLGSTIWLGRRK